MNGGTVAAAPPDIAIRTRPGPGPVVVWVHGYTLDASLWEPLWDRLPGYTHVGLDLPGHGHTLRPIPHGARLRDFAAAVDAVADACGADYLAGLSFGATVTLQAALDRPRRYAGLLLAACGLAGGPQDREAAECHLDLGRLARERGIGPWLADRWLACPPRIFEGVQAQPAVFERIDAVVRRHAWHELVHDDMASMARDMQSAAAIRALDTPVALLVGEHDMEAFKRSAHLIRKAGRQVDCTYAPARGHLPLLEDPAEGAAWVAGALAGFARADRRL